MRYVLRPTLVDAVFLDSLPAALSFLRTGEFTVLSSTGLMVLVGGGTIHAPIGECYLVRSEGGLDVMDRAVFESLYEPVP